MRARRETTLTKVRTAAQRSTLYAAARHPVRASLDRYMNWADAGWAPGAVQTIPLSLLRDHGLPASVGRVQGIQDVTPWARDYVVRAARFADGSTRGVVYAAGTPSSGLMRRSGFAGSEVRRVAHAVADRLADYDLDAGYVEAGASVVQGAQAAFSVDASALLDASKATASLLVGFPSLELAEGPGHPATPPPGSIGARCKLARASRPHEIATCPAGYKNITHYPHCGPFNTEYPVTFDAKSSPAGMVVFGQAFYDDEETHYIAAAGVGVPLGGDYVSHTHTTTVVLLQGAVLDEYTCRSRAYGLPFIPHRYEYPGLASGPCTAAYGYVGVLPTGGLSGLCVAQSTLHLVSGKDALCCL